ncbi:MAG TPA: flagellar motor protein MotB [Phycisphaerae bacterium]|jgi:outer membrane protein OmpA-like peptidoglycan-associated protein
MAETEEHGEQKHRSHASAGHGGGGHDGEHEGAPEWLISFADNVTLMMGFFVVLLAMNMQSPKTGGVGGGDKKGGGPGGLSTEALDLAIAVREAFNNPVRMDSDDPRDQPLIQRIRERAGESEAQQDGQAGREHDVKSIRPGDYFSQGGAITFDDGSSALSEEARQGVASACEQLRGVNLIVELRGHVSAAEAFGHPDRGMRLAYERASAVAEDLAAHGVGWMRLRLVASADNDRLVAPVYDPAGQRVNQRVEIIVTDQVLSDHLQDDDRAPPSPSQPEGRGERRPTPRAPRANP